MQEPSQLTFRISFWRPWLLAVTPLALLAAVGIVVAIIMGERVAAVVALLGFAAIAVVLLLPISLVSRIVVESGMVIPYRLSSVTRNEKGKPPGELREAQGTGLDRGIAHYG